MGECISIVGLDKFKLEGGGLHTKSPTDEQLQLNAE